MAGQYSTLAAIAAVAGLMLYSCSATDVDVVFDPPPDSTYVLSAGQLRYGDIRAQVQAAQVTAEFFPVVNRQPWLGRIFHPEEFEANAQPVVILSHKLWQDQLGGRPAIIGRTLQLDGRDHTVIGVMPPEIAWPEADLWVPQT